jgi:hypothetical protein
MEAQRATLFLMSLGLTACVTRGDIEEIKENQGKILQQLEKGARPQARPQRPRGPDRTATYAVPVGDSAFAGPKDAWVTLVEISDFQ